MSYTESKFLVTNYDREAEATAWYGPEVAFGLAFNFIAPGQSILDIGIGTGLGSVLFQKYGLYVYGLDISLDMLDVCRSKGFAEKLVQHDLTVYPYPFEDNSLDHAVCVGVFNFFQDLLPIFHEAGRIIKNNGVFVFVVGDQESGKPAEIIVGPEHTGTDATITMYLHSYKQVTSWLQENGFSLARNLEFFYFMDREKTKKIPARAYMAVKSIQVNQ